VPLPGPPTRVRELDLQPAGLYPYAGTSVNPS